MSAIYIINEYGKLTKKDETLVFTAPDGTMTIIFPFKTEQLVLMGNVSITGDALYILTKYKIPVTLLSRNGRFNGKLTFGDSKNVFLWQYQYQILSDAKRSLDIAKCIVMGKIKNEISFMQRIKRKSGPAADSDDKRIRMAISGAKDGLDKAETAKDINSLRGYEGMAARHYFSVFGMNIIPAWAEFPNRSKNPPKTNVNAVLSFLYTLLMYRVESAIESQGLDVCCGNLHALNYGKTALVFDLMEEFRTPIAEAVCCSLFNLGTLTEDDFENMKLDDKVEDAFIEAADIPNDANETDLAESVNEGVFLTKPGLKKVIAAFEEKLNSSIIYAPTGQKLCYKKIIYEQAEHYKRVIMGEETSYKPYYYK